MTTFAERTCRKKIEFSDPRKAKRKASTLRKHDKQDRTPYKCSVCPNWHLTRRK
jgi:hypothetical protein